MSSTGRQDRGEEPDGQAAQAAGPPRRLGVTTAMMLVVASMVGTGIFTTTGLLVEDVGNLPAVLVAWAIGGLFSLCGALAYGELVAALPANGGEYQLLSRIYHPSLGFVSGFTSLVVGFSAPIAASAIAFDEYLGGVIPALDGLALEADLGFMTVQVPPVALALIVVLSLVHALRVQLGGSVQNVLTIGKVLLILVFIAGGLWAGDAALLTRGSERPATEAIASPAFAIGLIYVSFAYSGWNAAAYVAGEVRRPARTLPLALLGGTGLVTVLYLGINVVFLTAAPASELSGAVDVGHVAATRLFGPGAGRFLSFIVALGLLSTVGALVMTGPRVYEAVGTDYPRLRFLARRHPGGGPVTAIVVQAALAIVMVLTASFDQLLTYIGFTLAIFAALTVAGVFVLRAREPGLPRPYRTWGHPVTEIVFILLMGWMIVYSFVERPVETTVGLATLGLGLVLYLVLKPARP